MPSIVPLPVFTAAEVASCVGVFLGFLPPAPADPPTNDGMTYFVPPPAGGSCGVTGFLELAEELLDDALPLLTGDVNTTTRQYAKATAGEQETLRQLSDRELLRKVAREVLILSILVSHGVTEQMGAIFEQRSKVAELAVIIRALSACFKVVARYLDLGGTNGREHR
jgi:hypothetical protein